MSSCSDLISALRGGAHDQALKSLYALDGTQDSLDQARQRAIRVTRGLMDAFSPAETAQAALFSGPGRTEIGGNHTDHQHGHVLCGSVDLDMLACAALNGTNTVRILSEGYPALEVSLDDLKPRPEEANTSAALVRGVAAKLVELGYALSGFDAYVTSNVLSGSGLSSSAAFEVLMCAILDGLYNGWVVDFKTRAVIAQKVENVYFGKPCGLLDQMAASAGGMVALDFETADAKVDAVACDFAAKGYALCVVNTGGDHGDLTDDYAAIPAEMKSVAAQFGKKVLREVDPAEFEKNVGKVRAAVGDRPVLRAMHFFDDNARVVEQVAAVREGNLDKFFADVTASGDSSWKLLQNVYARANQEQMAMGIELSRRFLKGEGAQRVHGGGFAGTIQAYVPMARLDAYVALMEDVFGKGSCTPLMIRPEGAVMMPMQA